MLIFLNFFWGIFFVSNFCCNRSPNFDGIARKKRKEILLQIRNIENSSKKLLATSLIVSKIELNNHFMIFFYFCNNNKKKSSVRFPHVYEFYCFGNQQYHTLIDIEVYHIFIKKLLQQYFLLTVSFSFKVKILKKNHHFYLKVSNFENDKVLYFYCFGFILFNFAKFSWKYVLQTFTKVLHNKILKPVT